MATLELPQLGPLIDEVINWKACIVCQKENGLFVLKPKLEAYSRLLSAIKDRALMNDNQNIKIYKRLQNYTPECLMRNNATWHRICYSNTTNNTDIQRARKRYERGLSTEKYIPKKKGHPSQSDIIEPSPLY